jgi:hypothetical protein
MLRRLTFACIALPSLLTAAERGQEAYHQRILPLLQKYCYDCHGDKSDKGDFALDEYPEYSKLIADKVFGAGKTDSRKFEDLFVATKYTVKADDAVILECWGLYAQFLCSQPEKK